MRTMHNPVLRRDLSVGHTAELDPQGKPVCLLRDPRTGRMFRLTSAELAFAQLLDGTHSPADALRRISAKGLVINAQAMERLLYILGSNGLLELPDEEEPATLLSESPSFPTLQAAAAPPPVEIEDAELVDVEEEERTEVAQGDRTELEAHGFRPPRPDPTAAEAFQTASIPQGPIPRLRRDLVIREKTLARGKVYELFDPKTRRLLALYQAELMVLKELDGSRDLFGLLAVAKDRGLAITPAKLWGFVTMLKNSGLLEEPPPGEEDDDLGRNEFSVVAQLPTAGLAVIPQAAPAPLAAPGESWSAHERRLFQVALTLFRRGVVQEAENHLLALLEINPDHKEARTLLEVVQRDKQRAMTLADVKTELEAEVDGAEQEESEGAEETASPEGESGLAKEAPADEEALAAQGEKELATRRRRSALRRTAIRVAVIGALVGAAAVIPYPLRATGSATAQPRERAVVRSALDGVLARIDRDEGDLVAAGDTIGALYDQDLRALLAQREAERQQAEAQLALLRQGTRPEEVAAAQAVFRGRSGEAALQARECEALRAQVAQRVIPAEELRNCESQLQSLRAAAAQAGAQLAVVQAGARPEEVQAAEARLRRTIADVTEVQARIAQTVLRSPIAGRVITPRFREKLNERVSTGDAVCEVARLDFMRVEVHVAETDMDLPAVGQLLSVRFANIPERVFEGAVVEIGQTVETEQLGQETFQFVRVLSDVANPDGALRAGLSGQAVIRAGQTTILGLGVRRARRWFQLNFLS